jgi:CubicO group peptidase (beta-lactamase class C family)
MDFTSWNEPETLARRIRDPGAVLPHTGVPNDPANIRPLPDALQPALADVTYSTSSGETKTLGSLLQRPDTTAHIVLHGGKVVHSYVQEGYSATNDHWTLSMCRSVVGVVAGKLAEQGVLDMHAPVETIIPELAQCGYKGATLRNLLDMRSGVTSTVAANMAAAGMAPPLDPGSTTPPRGIHAHILSAQADQAHGGSFKYRTLDTHVIGWLCEHTTGKSLPTLISDLLWRPMGAEKAGQFMIGCDGTPVYEAGLFTNLRDLGRFGQLLLEDGRPGAAQVLPKGWMADTRTGDDDTRAAFGSKFFFYDLPRGMYRNHLWVLDTERGITLCYGAQGQMVYVDPSHDLVCVLFSTWAHPADPVILEYFSAYDAIGAHLASQQQPAQQQ